MKNKTPEPPKDKIVYFDFVNGKPIVKKRLIKKKFKHGKNNKPSD